jgi:Ca2+-binding EF-hand superfamily protein
MSMFDKDRSGTIVYDEFAQLFNYVGDWSRCFKYFDRDNSGSIDAGEFDNALRQFGYPINPQLIQLLERKYDLKNVHPQHSGWIGAAPGFRPNGITFDKFVTSVSD